MTGSPLLSSGADDAIPDGAIAADDRRLIAHAVIATGAAERALVLARDRAGARVVAGRPLIELQSTAHRLARAAVRVALARTDVEAAVEAIGSGGCTGDRAPACAAAAAEAAFHAAQVLTQIHGAAGTSDPAVTTAFQACQAAASAVGPHAELWLAAGRRRRSAKNCGGDVVA